jgi:biopolymer transport protein ExbD
MTAPFNARHRRRKPTINITSLIDVMFLLLIFFMVSSTFRSQLGVDITIPHAETASDQELPRIEIGVTNEGQFYFGEQQVDEAGLRQAIVAALAESEDTRLVLRADEGADFGRVLQAIDITREVGGRQLIIPTRYQSPGSEAGGDSSPVESSDPASLTESP